MKVLNTKQRIRRKGRIRSQISGTADRPRLAVFRSNKVVYAQLIDDDTATTLVAADTRGEKGKTAIERAKVVGEAIARGAKEKKITRAVFDRGGFLYAGQVAAVAEGARSGGLTI